MNQRGARVHYIMASDSSVHADRLSERHLLLDVPEDVGVRLEAFLAGTDADVQLELSDPRHPKLFIDGKALPTAITSLPTVVETHKTVDDVNFFKTGAVGQVLVVRHTEEELPTAKELVDGLTPPTQSIRKKMWRKRYARDPQEVEQVALELEALRGGTLKPELEPVKVEVEQWVEVDDPDYLPQARADCGASGLGGAAPMDESSTSLKLCLNPRGGAKASSSASSAAPQKLLINLKTGPSQSTQQPPPAQSQHQHPPPSQQQRVALPPMGVLPPGCAGAKAAISAAAQAHRHGAGASGTVPPPLPPPQQQPPPQRRQPPQPPPPPPPEQIDAATQAVRMAALQQALQNVERLNRELTKLQAMMMKNTNPSQKQQLQTKINALGKERDDAQRQVQRLQ